MSTKEVRAAIAPLQARHDDIVAQRAKLEKELIKEQDKLRELDRTRDAAAHADSLGRVNSLKAQIAAVAADHVEHARAIALVTGGKNFSPPPGP